MEIVRKDVSLPKLYGLGRKDPKLAFTLDNVLSAAECEELIKETEDKGYEQALVNVGAGRQALISEVRNSRRCIIDSQEKAAWIWERIKNFVPQTWASRPVVGLNERLRFLKYCPGEYFKPHMDGSFWRPDGIERSFITIQLYLNEGFKGGNTTFMSNHDASEDVGVVPKIGRILVFQHDILHEGSLLVEGTKYTMRTDIMFGVPVPSLSP